MVVMALINNKERQRQVRLVPHNPVWLKDYAIVASELLEVLSDLSVMTYHIGSTAIPNIYAKPIIDIVLEVEMIDALDAYQPAFERLGYHAMGEYGISGRRFYWSADNSGKHLVHIHAFERDHSESIRHMMFKDYLCAHPKKAAAYSWIKRCLAEQFPLDIESYVNAKSSFVRRMDYECAVPKKDQLLAEDAVVLVDHNVNWKKLGLAEMNAIQHVVNKPFVTMAHVGSTAISDIKAKPIIDIFIALASIDEAQAWISPLEDMGYLYWYGNPDRSHLRFVKGMPPCGMQRSHHVHIIEMGEDFNQRVAFRDILNADSHKRQAYESLKTHLSKSFAHDR
jgi:GrpB-like predicted nucleotidyltransferase (UPF0157 family)